MLLFTLCYAFPDVHPLLLHLAGVCVGGNDCFINQPGSTTHMPMNLPMGPIDFNKKGILMSATVFTVLNLHSERLCNRQASAGGRLICPKVVISAPYVHTLPLYYVKPVTHACTFWPLY